MRRRRTKCRDDARVDDILGAAAKITRWSREGPRDDRYRSAVLRELGVIGEAAANLSDDFKATHRTVPWRAIIGLRNQIVHEYWDTAWMICEDVIHRDLPDLVHTIQPPLTNRTIVNPPSAQGSRPSSATPGHVWVPPHRRADGTQVSGYWRRR